MPFNIKPLNEATVREQVGIARSVLIRMKQEMQALEAVLDGIITHDPHTDAPARTVARTQGGNLRNLGQWIAEALGRYAATPLTSEQIAKMLYSRELGMSYDLFKRRVIVTVSAMSKRENPVVVPAEEVGPGKEKRWMLSEMKHEGHPEVALHDGRGNEGEGKRAHPSSLPELS